MTSKKSNYAYLVSISVFSILALFLYMTTLKLVYSAVEILLKANEVAPGEVKELMALQVDNLKRYSNYCTNAFYLICYLYLIFTGITLMLRKIKIFLLGDFIFGAIQIIGISLFIQVFNKYELTGGFDRLRTILHHKLFWTMAIIPIIIYLMYGLLNKRRS